MKSCARRNGPTGTIAQPHCTDNRVGDRSVAGRTKLGLARGERMKPRDEVSRRSV